MKRKKEKFFENFNWMSFRNVSYFDYKFLYQLLTEREDIVNISHKKMPSWDEHCKFWNECPYLVAKVIMNCNSHIGYWYLTKSYEIGLFISKRWQNKGIGEEVLKRIITIHSNKRLLANINPANKRSIDLFKKHKFKLIQHTYELDN